MLPLSLRSFGILISDTSEYGYLLVGILVFIVCYGKKEYRSLWLFLVIVGALYLTSIFLAENGINTFPLYHLIGLLELIFLFLIYRHHGISKNWIYVIIGGSVAYILNSIFIVSIYELNSVALSAVRLIMLIVGFDYLRKIYTEAQVKNLGKQPFFLINAGFMIYAAGSFFSSLMGWIVVKNSVEHGDKITHDSLWIIVACVALIRLILIILALRLIKRDR